MTTIGDEPREKPNCGTTKPGYLQMATFTLILIPFFLVFLFVRSLQVCGRKIVDLFATLGAWTFGQFLDFLHHKAMPLYFTDQEIKTMIWKALIDAKKEELEHDKSQSKREEE